MNAWMALPPPVRLSLVALAGAWVGTLASRWSARLSEEEQAQRSSLRLAPGRMPSVDWLVWLPLLGAWRNATADPRRPPREANRGAVQGGRRPRRLARTWRPLVVELTTAGLFAGLYGWETLRFGLVIPPLTEHGAAALAPTLFQAPLILHLVLLAFMLAASLIDLDEKIIPDEITVTGTVVGLGLMYLLPSAALPSVDWLRSGAAVVGPVHVASPGTWPAAWEGWPEIGSLLLGVSCFGLWCFALLPRSWRARRGWRIALAVCWNSIRRERFSAAVAAMFVLGASAIGFAWMAGGERWQSLLSALVGLAVGGGIVWCVRIIGQAALGREAMGFGDVTLLAMIGAYLGWQAVLMVFFVAPFFGLALGIFQALSARDWEIPYGPFLCLGTLAVIVRWPVLWEGTRDIFAVGWLLPTTLALMLVLMALLLATWAGVKRRWLGGSVS